MSTLDSEPTSRQAKWRASNMEKVWAQRALRAAVKLGLVEPKPCEKCGNPTAEGHHPDYSRPAYVIWLCRGHHKAEHRRLKAEEVAQ